MIASAQRLARALVAAGIKKGDRVATLMWNHAEHLEAYFGIPLAGAALHTLNLRLHPDEIAYIANDAKDRIVIVDDVLLPLLREGDRGRREVRARDRRRRCGDARATTQFLDERAGDVALPALAETDAARHLLHERHDGQAQGRRLLASLDAAAHARRRPARLRSACRAPTR